MLLYVIIILFVCLLVYLLFAPILIVVDTNGNRYYLEYKGLLKASLLGDEEEVIKVRFRIIFFSFDWYPLKERRQKQIEEKASPAKKPVISKKKPTMKMKTIKKLMKSFRVKKFRLDLDTGDCVTNASLFPLFCMLNRFRNGFHLNYVGQNALLLHIENKPIRLIKSFINL
jgi:hypothetical protein